jgi:MoaA/NifB/PqqE/SkfB family radical SAM enzyme
MSIRLPSPCNLDCVYCYGTPKSYKELRARGAHLTYEEIVDTLDQAIELGCRNVSFVGDGEPFLYREKDRSLLTILRHLTSRGVGSIVFTNALSITPELAGELFALNVVIVAKQNSLDPEKQNHLVGKAWGSERLERAMKVLRAAGLTRPQPSRLSVHTVICKDNYDELPEMWRRWRGDNIIPYVQVWVPPSDPALQAAMQERYHVPPPLVRDLFHRLCAIDAAEFGYTWDADWSYPIAALGCTVVLTGLGLTPSGEAQICAYTDGSVGNVREMRLEEIVKSEVVRRIRRHAYGKNSHRFHYGCRALTLNRTGSRYEADPEHWMTETATDVEVGSPGWKLQIAVPSTHLVPLGRGGGSRSGSTTR